MSEIILRATALKITNKGGGIQQTIGKREGETVPVQWKSDTGSDYVTFICPHPKCGRRNKQSMYEAGNYVPANEDRIPFRCRVCRRPVEIERPHKPTQLIMAPDEFTREMAHRRRELSVNSTKLGRT